MQIQWNFPNNGCGQSKGVSDSGIETFTGEEIKSFTREICQNSLDAAVFNADNTPKTVRIEFQHHLIESKQIPGYIDYAFKIKQAEKYWSGNEKCSAFLQRASAAINSKYTSVLRVSDYNTTGLSSPYEYNNDGWYALTKLDGGATKSNDKTGSFGIGKNAPFCNSDYRLVFYRTLNQDNEIAAQGMSRFISFPEDLNDIMHTMTTGMGYYGNPDGNLPVQTIPELDKLNKRKDIGTDVFVYGFNGGEKWDEKVICEVVENFFIPIHRKLLTVIVNNQTIDNNTLASIIQKNKTKVKDAYSFYQALNNSETQIFEKSFHGMGTFKLRVFVDQTQKLNRQVLITRASGMKLFAFKRISKIIMFSAILEIEGEKLNKYFRDMETPAHDKWMPARCSGNTKQAKEYYNELNEWVRGTIQGLGEYCCDDEIEAVLDGVLQEEIEGSLQSKDETIEKIENTGIVFQQHELTSSSKGFLYTQTDNTNDKGRKRNISGVVDKNGVLPTTRNLSGTRHRSTRDNHKGREEVNGHDTVHKNTGKKASEPLINTRIIKRQQGLYTISFTLPRNIKPGRLEVVAVGENGKANKLRVYEAKNIKGFSGLRTNKNSISFNSIVGQQKVVLEISLLNNHDYAMEVNVYEHS